MSKDSAAKRDRKLLLEGFFSSFDEKPIASASIGQVHAAVLKAGSHRVVVKLVYTEIKQTMDVDLDNMRRGMLLAMKTLKVKANPMPIVHEIYKSFPTECNFLNELEYLNCIRSNMAKRGDAGKVVVPNCHTHITTQNMLVLEHLDGKTFSKLKIDSMSAAELAAARRALIAVIDEIGKEIVLDGLFQYACIRAQCCDAPLQLQLRLSWLVWQCGPASGERDAARGRQGCAARLRPVQTARPDTACEGRATNARAQLPQSQNAQVWHGDDPSSVHPGADKRRSAYFMLFPSVCACSHAH